MDSSHQPVVPPVGDSSEVPFQPIGATEMTVRPGYLTEIVMLEPAPCTDAMSPENEVPALYCRREPPKLIPALPEKLTSYWLDEVDWAENENVAGDDVLWSCGR